MDLVRGELAVTPQTFNLWLEFEHSPPQVGDDPADDYANVQVRLTDGRRYALNVWTFKFLQRARYPWPHQDGVGERAEYLLPPDLFVASLDRPTMESVVSRMLAAGDLRPEWLCSAENEPGLRDKPPV